MKFAHKLLIVLSFMGASAQAIPEANYQAQYQNIVVPFMQTGEQFYFDGYDGMSLSAVKFIHPFSDRATAGTILILPGRSEPWLKYGEVFYDLYQKGYNIYCYDHRGQGLSPHHSSVNPQIGDVGYFNEYTKDLSRFVTDVLLPERRARESTSGQKEELYLLAHSMGGAIGAQFLAYNPNIFHKAILSAPMLQINTKPYPEFIARGLAFFLTKIGKGGQYAPGQGDVDPNESFEGNTVTGCEVRFEMSKAINKLYPSTIIGGPSSHWVWESIRATHRIQKAMANISTPVLLLQALNDQIVMLNGQDKGCSQTEACKIIHMLGSEHEILMEKDSIRNRAFSVLLDFFTHQ